MGEVRGCGYGRGYPNSFRICYDWGMSGLWEEMRQKNMRAAEPLAVRMRPRELDEFAGQKHFLGEGKLLRRMLEADRITSVIFYGPSGNGEDDACGVDCEIYEAAV